MAAFEYLCTQNAHDPEALTRYMNNAAAEGWDLFAVTFAIRGEGGIHTMFWRRPLQPESAGQLACRPAGTSPRAKSR
jgi:hypothetical protein